MRFIGDVHAKYDDYKKLLTQPSIQVGDLGFNYSKISDVSSDHTFIKGNHDKHLEDDVADDHFMGRYGFNRGVFFVGGAKTVDRWRRVEGFDWYANEELSTAEMNAAISLYNLLCPAVVVTHDCPQAIAHLFFGIHDETHTRRGLQEMWQIHSPKLWVFGHHHRHADEVIGETRFVCLEELEVFDYESLA
jgi:hypothetical protein